VKSRLVRVAASEAALLTPRRCMALVKVDEECGAPPEEKGWWKWADGLGAPLSLCASCRRSLAGPTPEERAATRKAFEARQTLLFTLDVVDRRLIRG
jgi:hypothetical protein